MVEEAPAELRAKLAPMWKYCFVQWHIYDAGLEALSKGRQLRAGFEDAELLSDVESLKALCESGDLDEAATAQEWTWKLLEPFAQAGSLAWDEQTSARVLKDSRDERKDGIQAFSEERYEKALWHFRQGLKLLAGAPAMAGPQNKLSGDLLKNRSAAALKLGMKRTALLAATAALAVNSSDEKAWYRKSCVLAEMGQEDESRLCMQKAGLTLPATPSYASSPAEVSRPQQVVRPVSESELDPALHRLFEDLVFLDIGVDSLIAVDMVMHLQAELPEAPIALTLIYDNPTVDEVITELLGISNAGKDDFLRRKMIGTVWRSVRRALGKDPLKGRGGMLSGGRDRQDFSEEEAMGVLEDLQRAYEAESWVQTVRTLARKAAFEQRSFLLNLRSHAMSVQRPILQALGFSGDAQGLKKLECSIISCSRKSNRVCEKLKIVRMALQGGPNSMWAINVEAEGMPWTDVNCMQSRALYTKDDPFGPNRINTKSVMTGVLAT
ncbi:unnamed protein product [Polarella glacialis]|uniref:Carrier domain-containing protein n=1 Tax=Polarella glacialis TaxID=89957 RepID=A0A813JXD6_POLGL|nr:unnamed protein product [Polarella glacialis]